jgi:hypothetical protein
VLVVVQLSVVLFAETDGVLVVVGGGGHVDAIGRPVQRAAGGAVPVEVCGNLYSSPFLMQAKQLIF